MAIARWSIGTRPLAGTWARAKPSVEIDAPTGVVAVPSPTLSFTFSSPVGRSQYSYQFQVRSADGVNLLFDSSTVNSVQSTDIEIPFMFSGGSEYQIWVRAADAFDLSDWDVVTITVDLVDVNDFPENKLVGSVYEVAINGLGLMLDDNPERPVRRKLGVLQPPRFATGETPFSEAVERYTFLGQASFKGGAGQTWRDRPLSDETRFWDSEGINPFQDDALQLLNLCDQAISTNYAKDFITVASGTLYTVTGIGELTGIDTPSSFPTTFVISGAGACTDLCSDGKYWYYTDGANIYRNNAKATVAAWASHDAKKIRWASDRIVITYVDGSSNIVVSTLTDTGAEEVAGGRFKYPNANVTIDDLTAGDGYMWFTVNRVDSSQIHFWKIGDSATYAAPALTLPYGHKAVGLGFYLGNVFIRAQQLLDDGGCRTYIYRCVPSDGVLTPEIVAQWDDTFVPAAGSGYFTGFDRFVFWGRKNMTELGRAGLMALDLSTGGYAKWVYGNVAGDVSSVALWGARLTYSVAGWGTFVEGTVPVSQGWIKTSLADQASGLTKVYDEVRLTFDPLTTGTSVMVECTHDGGNTYDECGPPATVAGVQLISEQIARESRSIGLKIMLGTTGANSPKVRHTQVKLHALSLTDDILELPVKCADAMDGLNGRPLPTNGRGGGIRLVRTLRGLIGTRVKLQDVDWAINQISTVWELVDLDAELVGVFNSRENRRVDSGVATITLRRSA